MNQNLTDITLIVDRSGSMSSCQQEAQNGINHFIESQQKEKGEAVLSLIHFDTEYEFVHKAVPIRNVPRYTLEPRGMTALLDAVGRGINEVGERLKNTPDEQRPGLVVFVIVTDGMENSSHEFKKSMIKEMIQHQRDIYKWQFTFLGANQDAFAEASGIGILAQSTANFTLQNATQAYTSASLNVSRMRSSVSSGQTPTSYYTDAERKEMEEGDQRKSSRG